MIRSSVFLVCCALIGCAYGKGQQLGPASECASDLVAGGYIEGYKAEHKARRVAQTYCDQYTAQTIGLAKGLVDQKYVPRFIDGLHAVSDATPAQVECAKAEVSARPADERKFVISDQCKMAVAPQAVEASAAPVATVDRTLLAVIKADARLSRFAQLVSAEPGMDAVLSQPGPITVAAPTDEAFAKANPAFLQNIEKTPGDRLKFLQKYIWDHALPWDEVPRKGHGSHHPGKFRTLAGKVWQFRFEGDTLKMGTSKVVARDDAAASNGTLLLIDEVLFR